MIDLTNINYNPQNIRLFRLKYVSQKNFNVGLILDNIDYSLIKILTKIKDIKLYSFDDSIPKEIEEEFNISNLSKAINNDFNIIVGIKSMHLIVTNNLDLINLAGIIEKSTFAIASKKMFLSYTNIRFYSPQNVKAAFVKIKQDLENYRVELREKYLLSLLSQVQKEETRNLPEALSSEVTIYYQLFDELNKQEYLHKYLEINEKLFQFPEKKSEALSNYTTFLGLFTDKKEEAQNLWDKEILPYTKDARILYNYACFQLLQGNFKNFAKYYTDRLFRPQEQFAFSKHNIPVWTGEKNTKDKTILVISEYGIGDNIIFLQHIEKLKKSFKRVIFSAMEPIYQLSKDSFKNIEVFEEKDIDYNMGIDYISPVMSIPVYLNIFPSKYQKNKWLYANKTKVKFFKKYFSKDKFNIGIFWESQKNKYNRQIDLETLLPLAYIDKVQLYSLHIDKEDFEINYSDDNINIINIGKHFKDFSDTASAIENCDLIISTDSSVLNLAGAMGKLSFGIFNKYPEWRWYKTDGENVGWYKSIKPFQAKEQNNFKPEIDKIIIEVKNLVQKKFEN